MKLRYKTYSQREAFPLPCCPWAGMEDLNEILTAISSENIQLLQSYNVTDRKKLEQVVFAKEASLHKKIRKKEVYVNYGAVADIPEDV